MSTEVRKVDLSYLSSPYQVYSEINISEKDPVSGEVFSELMKEQIQRHDLVYCLALIREKQYSGKQGYYFDAFKLEDWLNSHDPVNPSTQREIKKVSYFILKRMDDLAFKFFGIRKLENKDGLREQFIQTFLTANNYHTFEDSDVRAKKLMQLADFYAAGKGVEKSDEEAFKWYQKAAQLNNAQAQFILGDAYFYGKGVEESDEEAIKWYRKAAENGHVKAQYALAMCYRNGEGVEGSDEECEKWLWIAADLGYAEAQYDVGIYYQNSEENAEEAMKWFQLAAKQGHEEAKKELTGIHLSKKQRTQ